MKPIFTFLLLLLAGNLSMLTAQQATLNLEMNASVKEIIKAIEQQSDYSFVYNETLPLNEKKQVYVQSLLLEDALKTLFHNTDIQWKMSGKHIILQKASQRTTLSGYITDKTSGETLIGASVLDAQSRKGTITNNYGYFSFPVPNESTEIQISYIGYKSITLPVTFLKDTLVYISLERSAWLKEVVVDASAKRGFSPNHFMEFSMKDIQNTPAAFGEADILKTLQLLPGVQSGVEGTSGMYVRGGGPDQNLTLLDGVNIYNTSHFFGLFSIFNADAVKKVTLYKGSFPARFGGRLSSVVDVRLKDGNMQNYHGNISLGLLSSHFNLEGPIVKDRTSFNISARRSYIDAFLYAVKALRPKDEAIPIVYFYDLNAKLNHKFSDKSRLYLSVYNGRDKLGVKTESKDYQDSELNTVNYHWGSLVTSLRWNYVFNPKLFANFTAAYNNYNFDFKTLDEQKYTNESASSHYRYSNYQYSGIKDWSTHADFEYFPDNHHHIRFGMNYIYHTFSPEVLGSKQYEQENGELIKNIDYPYMSERIVGNEMSLYGEDEISLNDKWKTNIGLHLSLFNVQGKTYTSIQPRLSLGYEYDKHLSFKSSYSEMSQYIHLLASSMLSQPTDIWVPVTPELAPLRARQTTLGVFYDTHRGYEFSVEGFYKKMNNLLEYKDGASWGTPSTPWYKQVEAGTGQSYGIEFFARKSAGKFSGWLGYTWAWNNRKFKEINDGKRYPAKYDRRHDVKLNLSYKPSKRIDFSAAWVYATGNTFTLAMEEYAAVPVYEIEGYSAVPVWIDRYEDRNNFRMPAIHHLDLSVNYYRKKSAKGRQGIWNLTVYNVYNQPCPYYVYPMYNGYKQVLRQTSFLPTLPSISYTYKF